MPSESSIQPADSDAGKADVAQKQPPERTVDRVDFWENFYQPDHPPWDLGKPAPPFASYLRSPEAVPAGEIIILGCGTGHECLLFGKEGFKVTAVDFAPSPVRILSDRLAAEGLLGTQAVVMQRNVFDLGELYGRFDYVLEHTCFCAIHPSRRIEYLEVVRGLLKPGGRLIGLWWLVEKAGNPPYAVTKNDVLDLFSRDFVVEQCHQPGDSVVDRAGQELFTVMRKRP
jgi:SAM-dependent methyltransferase